MWGAGCHDVENASISVHVIVVGLIALYPSSHEIVCISPAMKDDAKSEMIPFCGAVKALHLGTETIRKLWMVYGPGDWHSYAARLAVRFPFASSSEICHSMCVAIRCAINQQFCNAHCIWIYLKSVSPVWFIMNEKTNANIHKSTLFFLFTDLLCPRCETSFLRLWTPVYLQHKGPGPTLYPHPLTEVVSWCTDEAMLL